MTPFNFQQLPSDQARKVLRLTLAMPGQSLGDVEAQVSTFINHSRALNLDLGGQWLAMDRGRIAAACSSIASPGRTGVLFLPAYGLSGGSESAQASLIELVISDLHRRNIRLAQCLLHLDDRYNERILLRGCFRPIAELIYLERLVCTDTAFECAGLKGDGEPSALFWDEYNPSSHRDFAELIIQSYQGSLDCPALTGLREIEDIIAGHKAVGLFQSHRWRLARLKGRAVGCILLGENPLRRVLEVAYMGVHPDFRSRGIGRALLDETVKLAYRERFEKVALAVDAANVPATRLYNSVGFVENARRRALIRDLHSTVACS